jgi:hypothetical protein
MAHRRTAGPNTPMKKVCPTLEAKAMVKPKPRKRALARAKRR